MNKNKQNYIHTIWKCFIYCRGRCLPLYSIEEMKEFYYNKINKKNFKKFEKPVKFIT